MGSDKIIVVGVDQSTDLSVQFSKIAESIGSSVLVVHDAWRQRKYGPTESSSLDILPNVFFDIKEENSDIERKPDHSYSSVKKRNKFFEKKHR